MSGLSLRGSPPAVLAVGGVEADDGAAERVDGGRRAEEDETGAPAEARGNFQSAMPKLAVR